MQVSDKSTSDKSTSDKKTPAAKRRRDASADGLSTPKQKPSTRQNTPKSAATESPKPKNIKMTAPGSAKSARKRKRSLDTSVNSPAKNVQTPTSTSVKRKAISPVAAAAATPKTPESVKLATRKSPRSIQSMPKSKKAKQETPESRKLSKRLLLKSA